MKKKFSRILEKRDSRRLLTSMESVEKRRRKNLSVLLPKKVYRGRVIIETYVSGPEAKLFIINVEINTEYPSKHPFTLALSDKPADQ